MNEWVHVRPITVKCFAWPTGLKSAILMQSIYTSLNEVTRDLHNRVSESQAEGQFTMAGLSVTGYET